jgi:hypothetical protein
MPARTRPFRSVASAMEYSRQAHGILLYVLLAGVVGVALAVTHGDDSGSIGDRETVIRESGSAIWTL